jgi:uncharacterized surface protein with fasciclin (FAS1) repeats
MIGIFIYGTVVFALVCAALGLLAWGIVNERRDRTQFEQARDVFGEQAALAVSRKPEGAPVRDPGPPAALPGGRFQTAPPGARVRPQNNQEESKMSGRWIGVPLAALIVAGALLAGCGGSDSSTETSAQSTQAKQEPATVVVAAQKTPSLSTLTTAVTAAGLAETLSGPGPYTVFAPTNQAFDALPKGQLEDLLKPANKQQLADILSYHVVSGSYPASSLMNGQQLKTLQGGTLKITVKGSKVEVNGVPVEMADVQTGNGVVHVIGSVLTPPGN